MIVLDTDHLTVAEFVDHSRHMALMERLRESPDQHIVTTVITLEEQIRGWMGAIKRRRDVHEQIPVYERLKSIVTFFQN